MLNPKIEKRQKAFNDYGLFAKSEIKKGELIWQPDENENEYGQCLTIQEIEKLPNEQKYIFLHFCYQIDENLFSGYTEIKDIESDPANYMNHSCDPNSWYDGDQIVARRNIEKDEEICYDYSTDTTDRDFDFNCNCGSNKCRGFIKKDDWKKLRDIYGEHFIAYIRNKLDFK